MAATKKTPARKPAVKKAPAKKAGTTAKIICTCDRLPLPDGHVLHRDMTAEVPIADAKTYEATERARRV